MDEDELIGVRFLLLEFHILEILPAPAFAGG